MLTGPALAQDLAEAACWQVDLSHVRALIDTVAAGGEWADWVAALLHGARIVDANTRSLELVGAPAAREIILGQPVANFCPQESWNGLAALIVAVARDPAHAARTQAVNSFMKIVVIGGTGLIGSKTVALLARDGHEVFAAAPNTGVNTLTGEGLDRALEGAEVVIDVSNSPTLDGPAALDFFEKAGRNIAAAEKKAGVHHHIALSVVGTDRLQASGYFRAKLAQEQGIAASGIPFTLIHATQFFEFLRGIANSAAEGDTVRLPPARFQPMAAQDVAVAVARAARAEPVNGMACASRSTCSGSRPMR